MWGVSVDRSVSDSTLGQLSRPGVATRRPLILSIGAVDRERFAELLEEYDTIGVTGMPISGKTIYTEMVHDRHLLHTDHLHSIPFLSRFQIITDELGHYDRWVLAGVLVPLWMVKSHCHPQAIVWLPGPRTELEGRQKSSAKGTRTLFYRWKREHPDVPVYL